MQGHPLTSHRFALALCLAVIGACSAGADDTTSTTTTGSSTGQGTGGGGVGGAGAGGDGVGVSVGSTGTGSFQGEECGREAFGNAVPASVLIVLDKSGSMAGGDGQPDKWTPTVAALTQLTQTASPDLKVGLNPFPGGDCDAEFDLQDGCCRDVSPAPVIPVRPLAESGPTIVSWLAANDPNGNTPTLWALKYGYNIMRTLDTDGERFVLLVTDGAPTTADTIPGFGSVNVECLKLEDILAEAAGAAAGETPVKTFVIGSPGTEGVTDFLSQLAVNGQTAPAGCSPAAGDCHFQIGSANYQADLQEALDVIAGTVSECVFALPEGEDIDPDKVNVIIETADGPVEVFRDPAHLDGWDYVDSTQTKIQLFGPPCELYQSASGNRVVIVLGCETVVK